MVEQPTIYNTGFYEGLREGSRKSAQRIVPEALRLLDVKSVVDVGCGVGTWLRVFLDLGITDALGIDGEYVDTALLEVPANYFKPFDLQKPFRIDRKFDLVVSLEVAEHIPPERAATFVESLTLLGPVVMFSGAIPFQNGNNHLNEQWPDYWVKQFAEHGYVPVDCIRRKVWSDPDVEPWYAQNTLLFVKEDRLESFPELAKARCETIDGCLSYVHPKIYFKARYEAQLLLMRTVGLNHLSVRKIIASLPRRVARAFVDRLKGRSAPPMLSQVSHPSAVPQSAMETAHPAMVPESAHARQ